MENNDNGKTNEETKEIVPTWKMFPSTDKMRSWTFLLALSVAVVFAAAVAGAVPLGPDFEESE